MTEDRASATVFRAKRWLKILVILSFLLFLAGAAFSFAIQGLSPMTMVFSGFVLLGVWAVFEVFVVHVALLDSELVIASSWRRRRYQRSLLEEVTWAAGSGVSIRLADGSWVRLPELGHNSSSLSSSIRAWLKRTPRSLQAREGG